MTNNQRNPKTTRPRQYPTMNDGNSGFLELALSGGRKKCLYLLLLALMLLIVLNLALTLWILKVMEFSADGMGQVKVVPGGLQLSGQAVVMDLLRASTIRSRHAQPIAIESAQNLTINTRDEHGHLTNQLLLGHDRLDVQAPALRITDTQGKTIFSVAADEVVVGASALRVDGEGGALFPHSVQTSSVRSDAGRELRLQSPTRSLEASAAQEMLLHSHAGSLEATVFEDLQLRSVAGSIRFDSPDIRLEQLKTAKAGMSISYDHTQKMFQVCACANGKLFLAPGHGICAGDDQTVCR